jgi:hypothetical protein
METKSRSYSTKDVDFLVTSATIVESAITHKAFLQTKRSTWADPFFDDLKKRIDAATQNFLGVDSAKDLRGATQALLAIQKQATADLAICKVQIVEDFKKDKTRRDELLRQLGFTGFLKSVQARDQEALIQLLYQFKTNLTPALKDEIIAKGTAKEVLDTITAYADGLIAVNISQESFKGLRKIITAAAVQEFNELHSLVMSICKIAAKFYIDNPAVKDQFSFAKVSKTLNQTKLPIVSVAP